MPPFEQLHLHLVGSVQYRWILSSFDSREFRTFGLILAIPGVLSEAPALHGLLTFRVRGNGVGQMEVDTPWLRRTHAAGLPESYTAFALNLTHPTRSEVLKEVFAHRAVTDLYGFFSKPPPEDSLLWIVGAKEPVRHNAELLEGCEAAASL